MRAQHFVLLLIALWCLFVVSAQPSAYWRDSGEFILAATYLDIGHPAGFPLFGQLANLFALIPIGPVAFRVNAFCSFTAAMFITLTFAAAIETVKQLGPKISPKIRLITAIVPVLFLLGSPTLLKRSATAEMYLFDGVLVGILYLLALQWHRSRDVRYLLTIAFVAGLTLCNHAPTGLVLLLTAIIVLWSARSTLHTTFAPAILCAVLGVLVYAYIPVRAQANPPLNTGDANTLRGAMLEVTDGRDRMLRRTSTHNDISVVNTLPVISTLVVQLRSSARTLARELNPVLIVAGVIGFLSLLALAPFCGFLLAAIAAGNWYFFQAWDPDPWMPLFFALAVCAAAACGAIARLERRTGALCSFALCGLGFAHAYNPLNFATLRALSSYEEPAQTATAMLDPIPNGAVLIAEPSWFYLKYARDIEGVREDVPLLYQPAILFSGFFSSPTLTLPTGEQLTIKKSFSSIPQYDEAGKLISKIASERPIYFEAGAMNTFLSKVIRFDADGSLHLTRNEPSAYSQGFSESVLQRTREVMDQPLATFSATAGDSRYFAELKAVTTADLLADADQLSAAAALLEGLCAPIDGSKCGQEALNNLGIYKMRLEDFAAAEQIFSQLLARGVSQSAAVRQNLELARGV